MRLQLIDKRLQIRAEQQAQFAQLNHVQAADPALNVADEGLWPAHGFGQRCLGQSRVDPALAQLLAQRIVFGSMDGLGHGRAIKKSA